MPNVGDELHHFGWNACSSALCPWMAHPHVERRYLVVPGLRSSRVYVLDTKDDPLEPRIVKTIEPEEIAKKTGYSRAHTVHCGPDGIYVNALGNPDGDGPGGIFVLDHDTFEVKGAWERDRGPQELAYDFWWHLGYDRVVSSEWGTPNMVEAGVNPELLLGNRYGHRLHVWDMKRRHVQELDLGAEHQMTLELRPAHDPDRAYGFVGTVVSTADLSANVFLWERLPDVRRPEGDLGAGRVGRGRAAPGRAQAVRRGAAARDGHRAVGRRPLAVRVLLGHRRAEALRRQRSAQAARDRLGPDRRDRGPLAAPGLGPRERRAADGRGEPRRAPRLPDQLALPHLGRAVLPGRDQGLAGEARRGRRRLACARPGPVHRVPRGERPHQVRLEGGDASSDSYCFPNGAEMDTLPLVTVALLGAYHGLNPAMGWLFAVGLGMQDRSGGRCSARCRRSRSATRRRSPWSPRS